MCQRDVHISNITPTGTVFDSFTSLFSLWSPCWDLGWGAFFSSVAMTWNCKFACCSLCYYVGVDSDSSCVRETSLYYREQFCSIFVFCFCFIKGFKMPSMQRSAQFCNVKIHTFLLKEGNYCRPLGALSDMVWPQGGAQCKCMHTEQPVFCLFREHFDATIIFR